MGRLFMSLPKQAVGRGSWGAQLSPHDEQEAWTHLSASSSCGLPIRGCWVGCHPNPAGLDTWLPNLQGEAVLLIRSGLVGKAEKAMASHSSTLAWKIPWTKEPGRLQSMGSLLVRHE